MAVPPTTHVAGRRRIYRVKTVGLGVRVSPDVNAARTGAILRCGDIFEASVVQALVGESGKNRV